MSLSTTSTLLLNTSRDGGSTTALGSVLHCLTTLSMNNFFLMSSLNFSWCNFNDISSHPIFFYLGIKTNTHHSTTSFQVVIENDKVSPQPPILQTKQCHFSQPLLIRIVLWTPHQHFWFSLGFFSSKCRISPSYVSGKHGRNIDIAGWFLSSHYRRRNTTGEIPWRY